MRPAADPAVTPQRTTAATYPGDVACLAAVRLGVRGLLSGFANADTAILCVSELAANAMRHSASRLPGGKITVRVTVCPDDHVRIEVTDDGGAWTRPGHADQHRGLNLVHALAADWGIGGDYRSRTVWALIPPRPEPPRDPAASDKLSPAPAVTQARYSGRAQWSAFIDGPRLRDLRELRHLSRQALAGQAGISPTTLARIERQPRARCHPRTMARIAAALGEHPATITLGLARITPHTGS
jgi:serine/threonine-protein kinase RsbW